MRKPIEVDENYVILCGHGRMIACQQLGMKEIPVIIHKDMSEEQKRKYRYIDNAVGHLSDWNIENIQLDFGDDFDDERLVSILKKVNPEFKLNIEVDKESIEDIIPPMDGKKIVINQGDLIQLGRHKMLCGDSTLPEDVARLMGEQKADCVVTDLPYNVAYHGHAENTKEMIMNDKMSTESFYYFLHDAFKNMIEVSKKGSGTYIFHNHKEQVNFQKALEDTGYELKQQLIRNKPSLGLGAGDYRPKHELFFYLVQKGTKGTFYGDRTNSTVWNWFDFDSEKGLVEKIKYAKEQEKNGMTTIRSISRDNVNEYVHPTQKPVALYQKAIENSSKQDDIVLDLFLGSGVCLITCEKTNRICHGMELDPKYVQTIIERRCMYNETDSIIINGKEVLRSAYSLGQST